MVLAIGRLRRVPLGLPVVGQRRRDGGEGFGGNRDSDHQANMGAAPSYSRRARIIRRTSRLTALSTAPLTCAREIAGVFQLRFGQAGQQSRVPHHARRPARRLHCSDNVELFAQASADALASLDPSRLFAASTFSSASRPRSAFPRRSSSRPARSAPLCSSMLAAPISRIVSQNRSPPVSPPAPPPALPPSPWGCGRAARRKSCRARQGRCGCQGDRAARAALPRRRCAREPTRRHRPTRARRYVRCGPFRRHDGSASSSADRGGLVLSELDKHRSGIKTPHTAQRKISMPLLHRHIGARAAQRLQPVEQAVRQERKGGPLPVRLTSLTQGINVSSWQQNFDSLLLLQAVSLSVSTEETDRAN